MDGATEALGEAAGKPDETIGDCISLAELEAQITELAGQLNAANYRWLMLIAEFAKAGATANCPPALIG